MIGGGGRDRKHKGALFPLAWGTKPTPKFAGEPVRATVVIENGKTQEFEPKTTDHSYRPCNKPNATTANSAPMDVLLKKNPSVLEKKDIWLGRRGDLPRLVIAVKPDTSARSITAEVWRRGADRVPVQFNETLTAEEIDPVGTNLLLLPTAELFYGACRPQCLSQEPEAVISIDLRLVLERVAGVTG